MPNGRTKVGSYRDLLVWQKGIALVKLVYQTSQTFPDGERFGLISQMRRAAVSVPSNIAEGQARYSTREFIHFVSNAEGSVAEVDTQLTIALELGFCKVADVKPVLDAIVELRKMLNALRRSLQERETQR
ncbi:MAG: four helix bundle protein [Vicinamibacterales bacterium]|nr:four helix bundle protein [Vicinamibacterales bacterium]